MSIKEYPIPDEEALHLGGAEDPVIKLSRFEPGGWIQASGLPVDFFREEMKIYPYDIWIITPPKCGTTWMQEILWLIENEVDTEKAKSIPQFIRIPFMEVQYELGQDAEKLPDDFDFENCTDIGLLMEHSFEYVDRGLKKPRIIKTHLPLDLLPQKLLDTCKVVYVGRNPKDMVVSFYHHLQVYGEKIKLG